jgi:general secretion pathway protein E
MHAAQTGHLVLSTMHTNSAVAAFVRMMDLGVDARMFGSAVNIILGQRLVRLLCEYCKVGHTPTEEERAIIAAALSDHPHPTTVPELTELFTAPGCDKCHHSGFKGRNGIYEAILMDEAVETAVLNDPREHTILAAAKPQKIPTMLHDGIEKVLRGLTSLEELERVIELPHPLSSAPPHKDVDGAPTDDDFLSHVV